MASKAQADNGQKRPGPGRPPENRLGEDLAVYHAFLRPGAVTSAKDLAQLLRITKERAEEILDDFSRDAGEDCGPLVPWTNLAEGDDKLTLTRPAEGARGLRLTPEQADACSNALDRLGFGEDDEKRKVLEAALFPKGADGAHVRGHKVECEPISRNVRDVLLVFARSMYSAKRDPNNPAQVSQQPVEFEYKGQNDAMAKKHRLAPFSLETGQGGVWRIRGYDFDAKAPRSFAANDIVVNEGSPKLLVGKDAKNLRHIPLVSARDAGSANGSHVVRVACDPEVQGRLLSIEGATLVKYEDEGHGGWTLVDLPYFRADWLPRQLIALGGRVKIVRDGSDKETIRELRREVRSLVKGDRSYREGMMKKRAKK